MTGRNCRMIFLLLALLFTVFNSSAQQIPEFDNEDIPGYEITRNQTFDGSSLWGYMNGGADIYLEYGFEILRVQEFNKDDESLKMELYKMQDPVSAFGIYSIKTFKCKEQSLMTNIDCLNPYQYQLVYGNYYIQIINNSASEVAKELMKELAGSILKKLPEQDFLLPATYLTNSLNLTPYEIKMLMGPLGIQNKAIDLSDYFNEVEAYQIWYAKTEEAGEKIKYYEILFEQAEMKEKLLKGNIEEEFQVVKEGERSIVLKK